MLGIEVNVPYDIVCPCPHSIVQDGVGLSVPLYSFTELDNRAYLGLSGFATKP